MSTGPSKLTCGTNPSCVPISVASDATCWRRLAGMTSRWSTGWESCWRSKTVVRSRPRDACQRPASSTVGPGCLNEAGKEDLDFPLGGLLLLAAASRQRQDNRQIGPRLRKQVLVRAGRGLAAPKRGPDHGVRPHHSRARISNLAVFCAAPRRDSRSLLIICVIGRKRTARVIGDHHGRDVGTATVLLAATDPCRSG